jgi:hypothetical protein
MPNIITYTYPGSPYAFKVHSVISGNGIKNYRNSPVSLVLLRPELTAIGVSYPPHPRHGRWERRLLRRTGHYRLPRLHPPVISPKMPPQTTL